MSEEYDVGYGKPPQKTQFKKGQSGNSKGRPKKKKSRSADLQSAVLDMLDSPVTVTVDGETKQVPVAHAMLTQLRNDILAGSSVERVRAIKTLREICPGYNVPEEFEDAPTTVEIKLVQSDGFGNEFNPNHEDSALLKALWRQHMDGNVSLRKIVHGVERKLGRPIIDPIRLENKKVKIRT